MPGRIVLYGATGYMGALTAWALVASGARPVMAGRDQSRLNALAARLSQAGDGTELETSGVVGPWQLSYTGERCAHDLERLGSVDGTGEVK